MLFMRKTTALPSAAEALPGRATPIPTATTHFVNGRKLQPPYPAGLEQAVFGLGCFWGAERKFWELGDGIYATAVGYAGGHPPNPSPARGQRLQGPRDPILPDGCAALRVASRGPRCLDWVLPSYTC